MRYLTLYVFLVLVPMAPASAATGPPSFEPGKWFNIQLVLFEQRIVVFASGDGGWYFKTHDLHLPDAPMEGHICFEHEELGNAQGARFDNLAVWELGDGFDMDRFAAPQKRLGAFRPGSPKWVDSFSRLDTSRFILIHGDWRVESGYLWCPTVTSGWAQIRTAEKFRNVMLSFRMFREPRNTCNWAGVALRTAPEGGGTGSIHLNARSVPSGHRLDVWPIQAEQVEADNRAALERLAQAEKEQRERQAGRVSRWAGMLQLPVEVVGDLGQDVVVGDVRWRVLTAKNLGNVLRSHNTFVERKTTPGFFLYLEIEVENGSKEPLTFLERSVYDKDGRRFIPLSDALWYFDSEIMWLLKTVNPNVPYRFAQVYEIPSGASGLGVGISNLRIVARKEGVVELGL